MSLTVLLTSDPLLKACSQSQTRRSNHSARKLWICSSLKRYRGPNRFQMEASRTATIEADHLTDEPTDESDVDECSNEKEGWSLSAE